MARLLRIARALKQIGAWHKEQEVTGHHVAFIKAHQCRKVSRRHVFQLIKGNRPCHFLSDGERRFGLYQESLPTTVEFFDQYPLWDLDRVIGLSQDLNIMYPVCKQGQAYVLSTDLLALEIDENTHEQKIVAYSYKPIDRLCVSSTHSRSVLRTLQKLELERSYWASQNIEFAVVTDLDISRIAATNIAWARPVAKYSSEFIQFEHSFIQEFLNHWVVKPDAIVKDLISQVTRKLHLSYSDGFSLFRWGIWTHQIPADLDQRIHVFSALKPVLPGAKQ